MSIFNMFFAGAGGNFKTAAPTSTSAMILDFAVDVDPAEYILMWIPASSVTLGGNEYATTICKTSSYTLFLTASGASTVSYRSRAASNVRTSYSAGVFTVDLRQSSYGQFQNGGSYILYYR